MTRKEFIRNSLAMGIGLPFLSKIPVLNFLTGATLKDDETTNNYFLVKAMIIDQQEIENENFGGVD